MKKALLVVISLIIIVLVIFSIISLTQEASNTQKNIVILESSENNIQDELYKDWQIYNNDENKIEVRFHPYWEPGTYGVTGELPKELITFSLYNHYNSEQKEATPSLGFLIYTQDFDESKFSLGNYIEDTELNGSIAKIYSKKDYFGNVRSAVINLKNGNIFLIKVSQIKDDDKSLEIFNYIISTFKELN